MNASELRQQLAAIEHQRWSDWQQYMHGLARADEDGNLVIPKALADRWSRQYHTAYSDLTDAEKASDMEQVDRYWPLIEPLIELAQAAQHMIYEDGWGKISKFATPAERRFLDGLDAVKYSAKFAADERTEP